MTELFGITNIYYFLAIIPIVAFLYSSVGHGGASGYLALMAIFAFPTTYMKPSALLLNILVAGISFYYYRKNNHFNWKLFYPFAITSIPASFIGGFLNVNPQIYKQILGALLILSVLRLLGFLGGKQHTTKAKINIPIALIAGASIGFFSGMIGIGGGIILSPLILLLNWGNMKETAAVSALFIWVNSIAGMLGLLSSGVQIPIASIPIAFFAVIGGILGGYYGAKKTNNVRLKYILAFVLVIASIKLIFV
ncbi:MAG: sulfite exporter TauE/SafE family protein [Bacteroidia bacterium]|nr:sulfite exporter TauE/SafE family protein [Bacteroidia bacterium]